MTATAEKQPTSSTERVRQRRAKMRDNGWSIIQVELSPAASDALNAITASRGESKSQVIERAIMLALGVATA